MYYIEMFIRCHAQTLKGQLYFVRIKLRWSCILTDFLHTLIIKHFAPFTRYYIVCGPVIMVTQGKDVKMAIQC